VAEPHAPLAQIRPATCLCQFTATANPLSGWRLTVVNPRCLVHGFRLADGEAAQ
jgi:hypothetical protein